MSALKRTSGAPPDFQPFIPPGAAPRELSVRGLILGTILGVIFGASSLYLVLKVGITVSASIPVAVISLTLFRLWGKVGGRDATVLENNIVQTAGSAGESIAFVGPSGSGKTSLVKLLVGLYEPTEGTILYNGVPHSEIDKAELRRQIGFVTQDTQLFAGTIRENLLFVNPDATDVECLDALKRAQCEPLLERGGKGLDTVIGEGGVKLSGGEKQRLSIARALLRRPNILIFDEATSALDSITEAEIGKTIKELSEAHAHITVLVAHRLSTIMHADRIYVLEKGVIAESGTHEELLKKSGLYHAMWRQQIGERA